MSQITLLVWPCLSLTEKQRTNNHIIIFNDSISKFYQCRIRGFCQGIYVFFSICLGKKKNAEAIKFLETLKKYVSKNKIYFCLKKKSNASLIFLSFTRLSNLISSRKSFTVLSTDVCILFSYFFCSLISVSKKQNTETMLTLSYSYHWQKFNNKMNEKRSQEYQSMDPEYVTRQIKFWSFFWDNFVVWFSHRLENLNML